MNSILNSISYKKIIIFFSSENKNIIDKLTYTSISKYLQESHSRKIVFVDINDNYKVNVIWNRIYNNDIILGLGNLMLQYNFIKIIKKFNKNKIILYYNEFISILNYNITFNSSFNLLINSFYSNSNDILNNKLYFVPHNVINIANYFNHINNMQKKKYKLTVFFENYTNEDIDSFNNIIKLKLKENETIFNLTYFQYKRNLKSIISIVSDSKIVITDNFIIMELSALSFTSCIIYKNLTQNNNLKIVLNLNYIKYINDINDLKSKLIQLDNQSESYNEYDINKDYHILNLELKI